MILKGRFQITNPKAAFSTRSELRRQPTKHSSERSSRPLKAAKRRRGDWKIRDCIKERRRLLGGVCRGVMHYEESCAGHTTDGHIPFVKGFGKHSTARDLSTLNMALYIRGVADASRGHSKKMISSAANIKLLMLEHDELRGLRESRRELMARRKNIYFSCHETRSEEEMAPRLLLYLHFVADGSKWLRALKGSFQTVRHNCYFYYRLN